MANLDTRGFFPDNSPNQALFKIADTLQENRMYKQQDKRFKEQDAYRKEQDAEAENWRKVNLVQDLTDLSKHQTSSDVANTVANQKAAAILQKYTADASKLSYADLQGGISKEMSEIINGIDSLKTELEQSEASAKLLKQKYPSLDINSLASAQREDVLKRRLGSDGNFVNPMTVPPPSIDVTDPITLSKYLSDTKTLDESIMKAGGADPIEIASGDPYTNVVYKGRMPFWATPNFKPEEVQGGFLKKGFVPSLSIKSEDLPQEGLPALKGNPRKIVTTDVHEQFKAQYPLEIMKGTREMFPKYDDMSEGEKDLAERDYLYTKLKSLDKNNFQYASSKSPAITHNRTTNVVNTGSVSNVNDVVGRMKSTIQEDVANGFNVTRFNKLKSDEQTLIKDFVNKDLPQEDKYKGDDIFVSLNANNEIEVYKKSALEEGKNPNTLITTLPGNLANLKAKQAGAKENRAIVAEGKGKPTEKPKEDLRKKYNY